MKTSIKISGGRQVLVVYPDEKNKDTQCKLYKLFYLPDSKTNGDWDVMGASVVRNSPEALNTSIGGSSKRKKS